MAKFQINPDIEIKYNQNFLKKAEALTPPFHYKTQLAQKVVTIASAENFTQAHVTSEKGVEAGQQPLKKGESVIFDLGTHCVGRLHFAVTPVGSPPDAPLHLQVTLGETPIEMVKNFTDYDGWVSSSWLQEEQVHVDVLPNNIHLERRYAARFVKFTVLDTSPKYSVLISDVAMETETTANYDLLVQTDYQDELLNKIHEVSVRTLANCMHRVFEDGPKRDRRLWLGDLHLQAKVNYLTFQNYDLVKRCLYLFAGTTTEEGQVTANLFIAPRVVPDDTYLFDYSLFFVTTLKDYVLATNDQEALKDLYPVALQQLALMSKQLDEKQLIRKTDGWWAFIDWNDNIDKEAAAQGVFLYALQAGIQLALMKDDLVTQTRLQEQYTACCQGANHYLKNEQGDFCSGENREANLQGQVWLVLGGAVIGEEAKALMKRWAEKDLSEITTPYMMHYFVEALIISGNWELAQKQIIDYWGGMVKEGADTFWEAYKPTDGTFSPYGDVIINSYCHAWSCTPPVLLAMLEQAKKVK